MMSPDCTDYWDDDFEEEEEFSIMDLEDKFEVLMQEGDANDN